MTERPEGSKPSPLDTPTLAAGRGEARQYASAPLAAMIGPYRILGVLGEGGMGTVYQAEQLQPVHRQVALKVVRATHVDSPERQLRLASERRALARLAHPYVAQLFEAGTTADGNPYFAMELVPGQPITIACNERKLSLADRLGLFMAVCEGVLHAHQKGVIHRDLKPSNILVTDTGERLVPKIIDFGIAKALDEPLVDADLTAGPLGTPGYMSPEGLAATRGTAEPDTRADVYSLGVLLYELLCDRRPYSRQLAPAELLRLLQDGEPPRPSVRFAELPADRAHEVAGQRGLSPRALARALAGDLDWIVARAIATDREQRYPSVAALAADVQRFLTHQPVEAGPPTVAYRFGKLIRRHRTAVAAGTLLALALIGGLVARSVEAARANRAAATAEAARAETEQVASFLASLFTASSPDQHRGTELTARQLLDRGAVRVREELADAPLVRARLQHTIAEVYLNLGLFRDALPLAEEAAEVRRRELGEFDAAVAESLRLLAILNSELGSSAAAGDLFRRVVAIREKVLGPEHPAVSVSLSNLGFFLMKEGDFDAAQPLFERALGITEAKRGSEHPGLAPTLYNLALLHQTKGRLDQAEPLYRRALALESKAYGDDHPATIQGLFGLGDLYLAMGRLEEAETHLSRALDLSIEVHGRDAMQLSYIHDALGELAATRGDFAAAARQYQRALDIQRLHLPANHPDMVSVGNKLAEVTSKLAPSP